MYTPSSNFVRLNPENRVAHGLLMALLLLISGNLFSQNTTENRQAFFNTEDQNMWGPSFAPLIFDGISEELFRVGWNESGGAGGMISLAGQQFGAQISASTWGDFGMIFTLDSMTTGDVSVDYPVNVTYDIPDNGNIDKGDTVVIHTSYNVIPNQWELETNHPYLGRMELNLLYGFGFDVNMLLCFFSCANVHIIPNLNVPTTSNINNPIPDTMNIFSIGQSFSQVLGLVDPGTNDLCSSNICLPGYVHFGAPEITLPAAFEDFGLTGSMAIPYLFTDDALTANQNLIARGDSIYVNINLSLFPLLANFVPPPARFVLENLDGELALPAPFGTVYGATINYTVFRAAVDVNMTHKQDFLFEPEIYSRMQFPIPLLYWEVDPATNNVVESGLGSSVRVLVGNDLRLKFPCQYEELEVLPTLELDNEFTNHTYDSISFDLQFEALTFGLDLPPITVVPRICFPEICINIPYPCPTWRNPLRWCSSRQCTPAFCTPRIGFNGFSFNIGPLWELTVPVGSISPITWYERTWELEGFSDTTVAPFRLVARPYLAFMDSIPIPCYGDSTGQVNLSITNGVAPYLLDWGNGNTQFLNTQTATLGGLPAGPQAVSITDANGCAVPASTYIDQPTSPVTVVDLSASNISCANGGDGSVTLTMAGGTSPYTYAWSHGPTSPLLAGMTAGTYEVVVTDDNGCEERDTVTLTQPDPLLLVGSNTDVSCFGGNDGTISVNAAGGSAPYNYQWSNGPTTQNLSNVAAGSYQLILTDNNNCQDTLDMMVAEPLAPLSMTANLVDPTCADTANGTITAAPAGGTAPYTFAWINPQGLTLASNTATATNLVGGSYIARITDAKGCTFIDTFTLQAPPELNLALAGTDINCFGESTGSIQPTISGGTTPYTYQWSNSSGASSLSNVPAGNYTLTLTDAQGCQQVQQIDLTEPDTALFALPEVANVSCFGEATGTISLLTAGGTGPYTYAWQNGNPNPSRSGLAAGIYQVTITDQLGCTLPMNITVNQPAAPLAQTASLQPISCYGIADGIIAANATGGTAPYTYTWTDDQFQVITEDAATLANQPAGLYYLLLTDSLGCTEETAYTLLQPDSFEISLNATNVNCFAGNDGSLTVTVNGATAPYSYQWNSGGTQPTETGLITGLYTVTITDNNGCEETVSMNLAQPEAPLLAETDGQDVACRDGETGIAVVEATGGTAPYTYQWSNGGTEPLQQGLAAGTYLVVITDAHGCQAQSGIVLEEPETNLIASISDIQSILCFGEGTGQMSLSAEGGVTPYRYFWGDSVYLFSEASEVLTDLTPGEYQVRVVDANGCEVETSGIITQPDPLGLTLDRENVRCFGIADGQIFSEVTGGTLPYTYIWSDGGTTANRSGMGPGEYTLEVLDANGCDIQGTISLSQPDSLWLSLRSEAISCREETDGNVRVSIAGGVKDYSILWSTGDEIRFVDSLAAGIYRVQVVDAQGCLVDGEIAVGATEESCFNIPNTFTPNNDGMNDVWNIPYLYLYPEASVQIFNQWGQLLYENRSNYVPWDGMYQGKDLPEATYYYIVDLKNGEEPYTGPITILR